MYMPRPPTISLYASDQVAENLFKKSPDHRERIGVGTYYNGLTGSESDIGLNDQRSGANLLADLWGLIVLITCPAYM